MKKLYFNTLQIKYKYLIQILECAVYLMATTTVSKFTTTIVGYRNVLSMANTTQYEYKRD